MSLMKMFSVLLLSLSFSQISFAETVYFPGTCKLATHFQMASRKGEVIPAYLQLNFEKESFQYYLSMNIPEIIQDQEVLLSFPKLEIVRRNGTKIFSERYHDELVHFSSRKIKFYQKSPGVYEAPSMGVKGDQLFLSLFLTQYGFYLESAKHKAYANLSGSDLSVRSMLKSCAPDLSQEYLNGLTRKKEIGLSWETSYGLFEFVNSETLYSRLFNFDPSAKTHFYGDVEASRLVTQNLVTLMGKRNDYLSEMSDVQSDEAFVSLVEGIQSPMEQLWRSQTSISSFYQEGGSLEKLNARISQIENEIARINEKTFSLNEELRPVEAVYQSELAEYQNYLNRMNQVNHRLSAVNREIARIKVDSEFLSKILSEELKRLHTVVEPKEQVTTFVLSMDEIKEQRRDALVTEAEIQEVKQKIYFLTRIVDEMDEMAALQNTLLAEFGDLSAKKQKLNLLREQHDQAELARSQWLEQLDGLSFEDIQSQLYVAWASLPQVVTRDELKEHLLERIKELYSNYDRSLGQMNPSQLLAQTLCRTESFRKSYRGQCLKINNIPKVAEVTRFFGDLESSEFNLLTKTSLNHSGPFKDVELVDQLTARAQNELLMPEYQNLWSVWNEALFYRWMYFTLRSLEAEEAISGQNFLNALETQKKQYTDLVTEEDVLVTEIVATSVDYQIAFDNYQKREKAYFDNFQKVRLRVLMLISMDDLEVTAKGLNCLISESYFIACFDQIDSERKHFVEVNNVKLAQLADTVLNLSSASNVKLSELLQSKDVLQNEKGPLQRELKLRLRSYDLLTSGFEFYEIAEKRQSYLDRLENLDEARRQAEDQLASALRNKDFLASRGRVLFKQLDSLYSELDEYRPKLYNHCQKEKNVARRVSVVDEKIEDLVGVEVWGDFAPEPLSKACQIWFK